MVKRFMLLLTIGCLATAMAFVSENPKTIFLLGDSISLQYGPDLGNFLAGKYTIEKKTGDSLAFKNLDIPVGANGGDSRMVLKYLRMKVADPSFHPALFLLNCGLHDVKRNPNTQAIAVKETEYRQNLEAIYKLIASKKIPFIWIRTTGIIDAIHKKNKGFDRYSRDIDRYNAIANEVFNGHQVPIVDLFGFTAIQGENRFVDHAHYTPEVRKLQAAYIAGFIQSWEAEKAGGKRTKK